MSEKKKILINRKFTALDELIRAFCNEEEIQRQIAGQTSINSPVRVSKGPQR